MSGIWKDWCSVTSWHGVADLYRAGSAITRIVWVVIIGMTTVMFSTQIYTQYKTYKCADMDPWTNSPTFESWKRIPLPVVTVCNMNKASRKELARLNMSIEAASYIIRLLHRVYEDETEILFFLAEPEGDKIFRAQEKAFMDYIFHHPQMASYSLYDLLIEIAPTCSSVFMGISIKYEDVHCESAETFYSQMEGICYSFQPLSPEGIWQNQSIANEPNTMVMRVSVNTKDYAPLEIPKAIDSGLSMFIGFDALGSTLATSRITIQPGTHTWVSMQYEISKAPDIDLNPIFQWTIPDLPCTIDAKLKILDSETTGQTVCWHDCWTNEFFKKCGCSFIPYPTKHMKDNTSCTILQTNECFRNKSLEETIFFEEICQQNCTKPECSQINIPKAVASTKSPANVTNLQKNLAKFRSIHVTEKEIQDISTVNIFYETMEIKVNQYQLRTPFDQFISNVGGQLGLWAGISIITLYQALVYAITAVTAVLRTMNLPKWVKQIEEQGTKQGKKHPDVFNIQEKVTSHPPKDSIGPMDKIVEWQKHREEQLQYLKRYNNID